MNLPSQGTQARAVLDIYRSMPELPVKTIAKKAGCRPDKARQYVRRWREMGMARPEEKTELCQKIEQYFLDGKGAGKFSDQIAKELGASKSYVEKIRKRMDPFYIDRRRRMSRNRRMIAALHKNGKLTGKNLDEIAARIGVTRQTARKITRELNIRPFPDSLGIEPDGVAETANRMLGTNYYDASDMFVKLYWREGESIEQIGELLGFSGGWVAKWMIRLGIPRRRQGYAGPKNRRIAKPKPKGAPMPKT